ncbi:ATP-binding cassette domain-containing protein [Methylobrevis pamukkalensis]|uniref:Thiamine import ATP-binding protein ThiQ n=1 Tax=Methylobrevis pamukkalensis TaxID=1439726 RepID=A0A1E3GX57_9HYPH|nr:ATP-binding cassette domain-containing protein [Methylobrevis pamukkalensis]ODN68642.1 Thiamine import ATP-binding protein ThiQ [Methylobrevis pamukkalensis]
MTAESGQDGLVLEDVRIALGERRLLDLACRVAPGEILSVTGPSGSGKSSLFAFLAGFLDPAFTVAGRVRLDGEDLLALPAAQRRVGLMFQDDLLFPHMSVGGNLLFALPASLRGRAARRARVEAVLAEAGLGGYADRDPATLSGGQRARVALLRTLIAEPRALLLDEPFSKLDRALRGQIRSLVFDRARRLGLPTLLVTHDEEDAAAAGGPVVRL